MGRGRARTLLLGAAVGACVVLQGGCGERGSGDGWAGTIDTLSSGAVRVSSPMEGLWTPENAWSLTEGLRIGSMEGDGPDVFSGIDGLEVDPEGRIYVLDREAGQASVFAPDGGHLRSFGRSGQGPGEFRRPVGLDWVEGEGLWVADMGNARFSLFDADGTFVRSRPRQVAGSSFAWRGAVTAGDRIVDFGFVRRGEKAAEVLYALGEDGTATDTFPLPSYDPESFTLRGNNFTMRMTVPFSPDMVWRYHPGGYIWFGVSDRYRLYRRTLEGDTVRIVERAYEPVPVSDQERADQEEDLGKYDLDLSRIPAVKPAFSAIFWDDAGRLWIRPETRPEDEDLLLDVFDPQGRYLGRIRSPVPILANPPPIIRGDALWAATRDSLDVSYVVRLGIQRPSG